MALIACNECSKQVSETAPSCPGCGAVVNVKNHKLATNGNQRRSVGLLLGIGIFVFPIVFSWFLLRKGHSSLSRIIGFSWLALTIVGFSHTSDTNKAVTSVEKAPVVTQSQEAFDATVPTISAQQIAQAYEENTVAADQMFKGKRFKVRGVIASINTDFMGNPYVTIRAGVNQFMEPQFKFDKDQTDRVAQLRKGATVTLACTGRGDIAKTPMSDNCRIAQ